MTSKGVKVHILHTSGHADSITIEKIVEATSPKTIIPIHTENADWFDKYEPSVEFHETHEHLNKLQTKFSEYLRNGKFSWIYDEPLLHNIVDTYAFGMSNKELIEQLRAIDGVNRVIVINSLG